MARCRRHHRALYGGGRYRAATELLPWGVPLRVIARLLHEPTRRRSSD